MKTIISIVIIGLTLFISIYIFSNILLPIFYTIPRILKEKRQNNLAKRIPFLKIIWAPLVFSTILGFGIFLSYKYLSNHMTEIYIGVGLSVLMHVTRIGKKNLDMDDDFKKYFKDYLKSENESSNLKVNKKFAKLNYYTSLEDLKSLIIRAFEKYTVNDYRSAIAIYDKILDLNPLLTSELAMRAQCLELLNYNLDAIDDYELAISIDESDGNLFGLLGLLYQKIGNIDKAENFLKLSISKGWKMYEPNLKMLGFLTNEELRKCFIEECKSSENLTRRNKKEFEDDLSEIDRQVFNDNLIKQIEAVKNGLSLDPNNKELKELVENFYSKMN